MRVLVCGGRNYDDYMAVFSLLREMNYEYNFTHLIQGGATGADELARNWVVYEKSARKSNTEIEVVTYKADWETYGRAAGPIRNQQMLEDGKPDLVVAFPGGAGTADMVRRALEKGIEVYEV